MSSTNRPTTPGGRPAPPPLLRWVAALAVGTLAAVALAGCAGASQAAGSTCPEGGIQLGVEPYRAPAALEPAYDVLAGALADDLGCDVEVRVFDTPAAAVEAIGGGEVDLAHLTAVGYAVAGRGADVTPLVTFGMPNGNMVTRSAGIWVPADSAITRPGQLAGRRLALGEKGSTTGDLLPRRALAESGLSADQVDLTYTGGHEASLAALRDRVVDAAEIDSRALSRAVAAGAFDEAAHRRIWASGSVPDHTIVLGPGITGEFAVRIEAALLNLGPESVEQVGALVGVARGGRLVGIDEIAYTELFGLVDTLGLGPEDLAGPAGSAAGR